MIQDTFIHPSSLVDANVKIGSGSKIWHFCHISENASIGENCILGQNVYIGPNVQIGNNVKIQNNVSVYSGVTIEDNVFIGPSVVFTNVVNPRAFLERKTEFKSTLISMGSSLGANSTIICGTTIGKYALVGAGSVVTRDIKDFSKSYGNPAKHSGWVSICGESIILKDAIPFLFKEKTYLLKNGSCHILNN